MARRHPMRGCDCTTCTNERASDSTPKGRQRKTLNEQARYYRQTQESYERKLAHTRARRRANADARDRARLAALQGDDE